MRPSGTKHPSGAGTRRGAVMVMALACLAVSSVIAAVMLRSAVTARRAVRTERDLRQVECLLAAAADLARARLTAGAAARQEILLEPAAVVGTGSARITLAPDPAAGPAVAIVVEYPLEGPVTIRRSRLIASPSAPAPNPEESQP